MKANSFLLFFLYLLFTVSCTENEVEPSFSIGTTEDIEIAPEAGGQTQISFTSSREWQARPHAGNGQHGNGNSTPFFFPLFVRHIFLALQQAKRGRISLAV